MELYPTKICNDCFELLQNSISLLNKFEKTENLLCEYYNKKTISNNQEENDNHIINEMEQYLIIENENDELSFLDDVIEQGESESENVEEIVIKHDTVSDEADMQNCVDKKSTDTDCDYIEEIIISGEVEECISVDERDKVVEKYNCDICGKNFRNEENLKRHNFKIHSIEYENLLCQTCGFYTTSKTEFKNHTKNHKRKEFECSICNKKYFTQSHFHAHMRVHENKREFLCTICGRGFNYAVALEYHMRTHTGEKNYKCDYCGKGFSMKCTLNRHLRTHTGHRPYKCKYCDRALFSKGELNCHEYTHTGYRPYHCTHCNKGFTKKHNLKMHLLAHNGPVVCDLCKKTFLDVECIKLHLKISHNIVDKETNS